MVNDMVKLIDSTQATPRIKVTSMAQLQARIDAEWYAAHFAGVEYVTFLNEQDAAADEVTVNHALFNGDATLTRLLELYVDLKVS